MKNKQFRIHEHIGIFDNGFSDELCDKYIDYFDKLEQYKTNDTAVGSLSKRNDTAVVQDSSASLIANHYGQDLNINYIGADFQAVFWRECYPQYIEKYPIIKEFKPHRILDLKIQKTKKGEGYHIWHSEMMDPAYRSRFIVISLYLNTVDKGGETEFLNQNLRVEPVKNRFIMFPATYTHVHRGNPPLSGSKYIITGWVEF